MPNDDAVDRNLQGMDDLDFVGWNHADWTGVFVTITPTTCSWTGMVSPRRPRYRGAHRGHEVIRGTEWGRFTAPDQVTPDRFGSGEWTCVIGEFKNGDRMVTVAKWNDGAIAEEYIGRSSTTAWAYHLTHPKVPIVERRARASTTSNSEPEPMIGGRRHRWELVPTGVRGTAPATGITRTNLLDHASIGRRRTKGILRLVLRWYPA